MKRYTLPIAVLCLSLLSTPAAMADPVYATPEPLPGYTLQASDEPRLVYATKSIKANIAGFIQPGEEQNVQVLEISSDWCFISFQTDGGVRYGYLPRSCFQAAPQATPTPPPALTYAAGTPAWVKNIAEGYRLNLRQSPSTAAASLGKYYTGTPLLLTGTVENGFAEVLLADTLLGWMDIRYLTTEAAAFVPELPMVTVNNPGGGATLRSGPSTSSNKQGWLSHGTAVTVLGVRSDGWYHILVNDEAGYIAETMLSGSFASGYGMDSDNPTLTNQLADSQAQVFINTRSATDRLNLRKSASSSAKSLGRFSTGTPATVISYTRTGWAYVRIGQTEGYVAADYLTATQPARYGIPYTVRNSRANGLNLRSTPSTGGELLLFVPNYSTVTVLGELSDGWCYVDYQGVVGYMLGSSLKQVQ